ncbi:MAG: hypothetical protein BGO59_13475 [Spirosoma sp. 48-14]|nr:MAG: hypothetical protein BGO59_13475 [Spirosoma sp. 48-14]
MRKKPVRGFVSIDRTKLLPESAFVQNDLYQLYDYKRQLAVCWIELGWLADIQLVCRWVWIG